MAKHKSKFFFGEEPQTEQPKVKVKKIKEPKVNKPKVKKDTQNRSNRKGISFYGEKITYFIKNWLIIIVLLIAIIIIVLLVKGCTDNNKSKKPKSPDEINSSEPVVVDSITVNLNQDIPKIEEFVKNYSKVKKDTDTITYDQTNLVNNKYNSVGSYKVKITLNGVEYNSQIVVIDKEPPVFAVKDLTITEGDYYTINDFVTSCSDNSGKECILSYELPEYGKLVSPGNYIISIVAADLSGNTAKIQKAKLVINAKPVTPKPSKTCSFGSTSYTSQHVITYSLIKNNCPADAKYAKTDTYITTPEQMARKDLDNLKKQINNKNISMEIKFELVVIPVLNNEKTGLIGYAAYISGTNNETGKVVISYDINPNGTRKYTVNELGI
jgi:hypothetical protein